MLLLNKLITPSAMSFHKAIREKKNRKYIIVTMRSRRVKLLLFKGEIYSGRNALILLN